MGEKTWAQAAQEAAKSCDYRLAVELFERQTAILQWAGTIGFGLLTISEDDSGMRVDTEGLGRKFLVAALDAFKARVLAAYDEEHPDG